MSGISDRNPATAPGFFSSGRRGVETVLWTRSTWNTDATRYLLSEGLGGLTGRWRIAGVRLHRSRSADQTLARAVHFSSRAWTEDAPRESTLTRAFKTHPAEIDSPARLRPSSSECFPGALSTSVRERVSRGTPLVEIPRERSASGLPPAWSRLMDWPRR